MASRTLLAILLLSLTTALGTQAAQSRDQILLEVREQARKDAQAQRPQRLSPELQVLFGKEAEAASLSMRQVVTTYEDEYARSKPAEPWWKPFLPSAGWVTAILLFLVVLFKEALQKAIGGLMKTVQKRIYNRFAGHRLFRRKALRSYRQSLRDKYQEILLPFRPGRPLQMQDVYVPLQVRGTSGVELIEAQTALAQYPRLMVVGPPGSGKSMLSKNLALSYAEGRMVNLPPQSLPILLELNRLNEGDRPLRDHLVEILDLNGFPHGERFIDRGLEEGTLVLLFDGLDEVNSARREAVVGKIKDLLPIIAGRIAFLIARWATEISKKTSKKHRHSDFPQVAPQIILPLAVHARARIELEIVPELMGFGNEVRHLVKKRLLQAALSREDYQTRHFLFLLNCLDEDRRWDFFQRLASEPIPSLDGLAAYLSPCTVPL